jgi:hypothetical protein
MRARPQGTSPQPATVATLTSDPGCALFLQEPTTAEGAIRWRLPLKGSEKEMKLNVSGRTIARPGMADAEHAPWRLREEIVALSVSPDWRQARREWELAAVWFAAPGEPGTCLCGHRIVEHCVLVNRRNGNRATVGNVCVTRFMGLGSEAIFAALRRIVKDGRGALNAEAVEHAHRRGWINDWERRFYLDVIRRRSPSERQRTKRTEINERVLRGLSADAGAR